MIINLHLVGRTAVVIGGGRQAEKRITTLLNDDCGRIVVLTSTASEKIKRWSQECKIDLVYGDVHDSGFISTYNPYVVIATTNDPSVNETVLAGTKAAGILAYASDRPDESDFAHAAVIDLDCVKAAVFTDGQSPAVSKSIRDKAEQAIRDVITAQDRMHLKVQHMARTMAKDVIESPSERRVCLHRIMADVTINQLISVGRQKDAEARATSILREYK